MIREPRSMRMDRAHRLINRSIALRELIQKTAACAIVFSGVRDTLVRDCKKCITRVLFASLARGLYNSFYRLRYCIE